MGGATGTNSFPGATSTGGGKSTPIGQNNYGPSFGSFGGTKGNPGPGGKSSGAGQGGYGMAPGFQQTAQNQPSFAQSPYGPANPSTYSTTTADMMGGNRSGGQGFGQLMQGLQGGKSSGLGQGGYGMAPGFGGQQFMQPGQAQVAQAPPPGFGGQQQPSSAPMSFDQFKQNTLFSPMNQQFRTKEQETQLQQDRYQNYLSQQGGMGGQQPSQMGGQFGFMNNMLRGQPANNLGQFNTQTNPLPPPGFENMANNQEFNLRLQGSSGGAQMQAPTKEGYDFQMSKGLFPPGTTYEQWAQSQNDKAAQQAAGAEAFNKYREQQFSQPQFNPYQQQFNPYQQQQFNPFQQQFGGFQQQQPVSGLQSLFNSMMGQQQMQQPMQQMPRFQSQALQYRPNMQNAQSALSRVRPSVQRQQQDSQAARISELEAQLAGYNTPSGE